MSASNENPEEILEPDNESEEQIDEGLEGSYDSGVLHLSDTHGPDNYSAVNEEYRSEDVDYAVHTGDFYQMPEQAGDMDAEEFEDEVLDQYIESGNRSIAGYAEMAKELDVEVAAALYGNHDPEGEHPGTDNFKQAARQRAKETIEGYDGEQPLTEYLFEQHGIENLNNSIIETDEFAIVGGTDHFGRELMDEPSMEDLGYNEESLEEVAEQMEEDFEPCYSWVKDIPYIGGFVGGLVEKVGSWLGYDEIDVDPGELRLEDIPEKKRTDAHENYLDALEEFEENYDSRKKPIEEMINSTDKDILFFDHGLPLTDEIEYDEIENHPDNTRNGLQGSDALKDIYKEYGDRFIAGFGGHFHSNDRHELYGVDTFQSGGTDVSGGYSMIGIEENEIGYAGQGVLETENTERDGGRQQAIQHVAEIARQDPEMARQRIEQAGLPDEVRSELKEVVDMVENGRIQFEEQPDVEA